MAHEPPGARHQRPLGCHGKPTIRGLRHPVETLLELLAYGMAIDEVVVDHPEGT